MNAAKIVLGTVVAVGLTAGAALCHNIKNDLKEINSENLKNTTELPVKSEPRTASAWATAEARVTDTICCPNDTFWCKLTPEEAEYMRTLIKHDASYSDTIRIMSVDAAKKAYAEAKNVAKHIK